MGDLSAHFSRSEFRCKGTGQPGHREHDTNVDPELVQVLENLRAIDGKPLPVVSGKRCAWWNSRVGGARNSQHLLTTAADIPSGRFTSTQAFNAGAIGVGVDRHGWVTHVDTRESGRRALWRYR